MSIELTKEEIEYYESSRPYTSGPYIEQEYHFSKPVNSIDVYNYIASEIDCIQWSKEVKEDDSVIQIARLDDSTIFALIHRLWSYYELAVPVNEVKRVAGADLDKDPYLKEADSFRFSKLLDFLIVLARTVHSTFPLTHCILRDECGRGSDVEFGDESVIFIDSRFSSFVNEKMIEIKGYSYFPLNKAKDGNSSIG